MPRTIIRLLILGALVCLVVLINTVSQPVVAQDQNTTNETLDTNALNTPPTGVFAVNMFSNNAGIITIVDDVAANRFPSTINASGLADNMLDVNVTLSAIDHPDAFEVAANTVCNADGSLDVTVTAGNGNFDIRGVSAFSDETFFDVPANTTVTFTDDNRGPNAYDITITERSGDTQVVTLPIVNCNVPLDATVTCLDDGRAEFTLISADIGGSSPVALNYSLNGRLTASGFSNITSAAIGTSGATNVFTSILLLENAGDGQSINPADITCDPVLPIVNLTTNSAIEVDVTTDLGVPVYNFTLVGTAAISVEPGSYSITGVPDAGFYQVSATCDNAQTPDNLTLNYGDNITCTFVNSSRGVATLSQPDGTTITEGGAGVSVQTTFAPDVTGNVTLRYTPSDECDMGNGPGVAVPAGVSTPTASTFRDVTVADNDLVDGGRNCIVGVEILTSDDPAHPVGNIGSVSFTIADDDTNRIIITPQESPLQTSEAGDTITFEVVLTSEPAQEVDVDVSTDDTSEGTVSTATTLTFNPFNYDTPQMVTIMGADDILVDGDVAYNINFNSFSLDAAYNGDIQVFGATNLDNDVTVGDASLLIDPNTLLLAEDAPGSNSFTIALGQAPVAGEIVTVTFGYDGGQLALSQNSVQFDSSNFNQPITISVDAVADGVSEDILPYNITATTSSNLGNTVLNGLNGTIIATVFDNADLIIVFVPNIGTLTVFAISPTQVYESASGGVLRDSATTAEIFLPRDADSNGFDTYTITDYSMSGEDVWLAIWLGSANWGWVPFDADTMLLDGDIWEMLYNAQN